MSADRAGATLTYHLADRLGSYVRGIDSTGALSAQSIYTPYGNGGPSSGDDKRYTGQQQEPTSSLGLYYYKARFYSPVLGTFVSADSVTKDGLNRYAYTKWNPVRYTDPSGAHGDCNSPPCPSPAPVAGDGDAQDRAECRSHLAACAMYAFTLEYGSNPYGLILVMGLFQSSSDTGASDIGAFDTYTQAFLERYDTGCRGRGSVCVEAMKRLISIAGSGAAYAVFGIQFIESDPNGWGVAGLATQGLLGALALSERLKDPGSKRILGVVGLSLGAVATAAYFANNDSAVPFFLDSGPDAYPPYSYLVSEAAERHPSSFLGQTGFFSCGSGCGVLQHGVSWDTGPLVVNLITNYWAGR